MGKGYKLNARKIDTITARGLHSDGLGLYLQVTERGHRSWVYRFHVHGKRRTMGLGGFPAVTLKQARINRNNAKKLRDDRIDPIVARNQKRQIASASLTVDQAAAAMIEAQKAKWKTERHVEQVKRRLKKYVHPIIGHLPVADLGNTEVEQVLLPIWTTKNPTANRVRQYLEDTINWAIAKKVRTEQSNSAEIKRLQWSPPIGIHKVRHHPSLAFEQAPGFLAELRQQEGVKARALEFVMLTAVRVADVVGGGKDHSVPMLWSHVDLPGQLWRIPDTKMGKPHVVPLSEPAMMVLAEMQRFRDLTTDIVFAGARHGTVVSDATLRYLLKDMGYAGIATTHGLRSSFRTWCSETTTYDKDVIESCLAHAQGELDAAYHRGSYLDKRRKLMGLWAAYITASNVIPFAATA
jgi:integrase